MKPKNFFFLLIYFLLLVFSFEIAEACVRVASDEIARIGDRSQVVVRVVAELPRMRARPP